MKTSDKNYCPDCDVFLPGSNHKPLCPRSCDNVFVARKDYEDLLHTVQQLQTKYNAIVDDKQRWRNFAILSSATQLFALRVCTTPEGAVRKANELLTLIEPGETNGTAGADPRS